MPTAAEGFVLVVGGEVVDELGGWVVGVFVVTMWVFGVSDDFMGGDGGGV